MNDVWVLSVVEYRRRADKKIVRDKMRTPRWTHGDEKSMRRAINYVYDTLNNTTAWERETSRHARERAFASRVRLICVVGEE